LVKLSDNRFITLLVDSVEQIMINADKANFAREYRVEGSLGSILVKELNDKLASTRKQLDSLQSLNNLYQGNPEYDQMRETWKEQYQKIIDEQEKFSTNFVMNNPFSMASILALYQKFDNQRYVVNDLQTMRVAASALNSIYPESEHVKALYQNTVQWLKEEKNAQLQKMIQEEGRNSPEIVLPTPGGEEVALSSLEGNVVLLQFWSALDRNSRILNEALAEAYRKYNSKGFEIYQVSVDDNRIEWVDAIDKDRLNWVNVGDMKGSKQVVQNYNVQKIPYNYLLDKEGRIIAKDLKGPALNRALTNILK
ncbi:MAG TPA: TlpA disulfide reductase family protein, partial [Prolixibacteraceae bacterium]|nr:TlpA disulfide reductase family protein [Prolixibacteraceae bacterium]